MTFAHPETSTIAAPPSIGPTRSRIQIRTESPPRQNAPPTDRAPPPGSGIAPTLASGLSGAPMTMSVMPPASAATPITTAAVLTADAVFPEAAASMPACLVQVWVVVLQSWETVLLSEIAAAPMPKPTARPTTPAPPSTTPPTRLPVHHDPPSSAAGGAAPLEEDDVPTAPMESTCLVVLPSRASTETSASTCPGALTTIRCAPGSTGM